MSVAPADYLAAIERLPVGASLRFDDVSWEDYENLLADLGEGYAVRIFYDSGRMEVMAPASTHEKPKSVIHTLVTALRDELDIDIECLGSTTLKKEMRAAGTEPDDCFYVRNAGLVIGKEDLDLTRDPAPDLVVEIDRTSLSLDRFAIYVALGVPEIWRLARRRLTIYILCDDRYELSTSSSAFPFLSDRALSEFIARGLRDGERRVAREFREWVRAHHKASQ